MERLFGVLGDEPLYAIEPTDEPPGSGFDIEIGFSDIAAHPYQELVRATVGVLAAVPGVIEVWQEDREVLLLRAPDVTVGHLAEVVDQFWLEALTRTAPDPSYGPASQFRPQLDALTSRGATSSDPTSASSPVAAAIDAGHRPMRLPEVLQLPPSRRRMWTYLCCGAIPTLGGAALALSGDASRAALPLALGVWNLAVGLRIWRRRRPTSHGPRHPRSAPR